MSEPATVSSRPVCGSPPNEHIENRDESAHEHLGDGAPSYDGIARLSSGSVTH
jgi:hypothetical protein